eukprot:COSAG02_NODE_69_length_42323_cov_23.507850_21_plen_74_part_00
MDLYIGGLAAARPRDIHLTFDFQKNKPAAGLYARGIPNTARYDTARRVGAGGYVRTGSSVADLAQAEGIVGVV